MTQPALFDRLNPKPCTVYDLHRRDLRIEDARQENARDRVLTRLRQGPATNIELNAICFRYGARILELRREGEHIDKAPMGAGVWVYTWTP